MRRAVRYLSWAMALWLCLAWLMDLAELDALAFQQGRIFRNVTGVVVLGLVLFQWTLTLGRTVFQKAGSAWTQWVDWHLRIALILPLALVAHSVQLGWGLLAVLPLTLLAASHFGSLLEGQEKTNRYLIHHIVLSALTLSMALVHACSVIWYN